MILVPVLDDSCNKFMPEILKSQESEIGGLWDSIHIFLNLWHMVHNFKNWPGNTFNTKEFPLSTEIWDVYDWKQGMTYPMNPAKNYILCNRKDLKKMIICYVILDPEFFLLITPSHDVPKEERIKIEIKCSLLNV